MDVFAVPAGIDADPQSGGAGSAGSQVWCGAGQRGRVRRVRPGDDAQQRGRVGGAAGDWSDVVHAGRQRECAVPADASPGRLDPGQAGGRARPADGAASVGCQGSVAQSGGGGYARPAGGDPGPVVGAPWVDWRGDRGVVVGVGPLGHLQFAEDDRAGVPESGDGGGVLAGPVVPVDGHPGRGGRVLGPEQVLNGYRYAVQRPAVSASAGHCWSSATPSTVYATSATSALTSTSPRLCSPTASPAWSTTGSSTGGPTPATPAATSTNSPQLAAIYGPPCTRC